jgi:molecular chaperone GrpE
MSKENGEQPGTQDDAVYSGAEAASHSEASAPLGSDAGSEASETPGNAEALTKQVKELQDEVASLRDQYLRKTADFENFRKRMFREKEDAVKYANSGLLRDLITTVDDFERAIKSAEDSQDFSTFHEGVEMIEKQFTSMLERKYGLKRYESVGEEFDPERHEAISVSDTTSESGAQVVVEDYQKGFMLHDRVLRTAKVKVSAGAPVEGASGAAADGPERMQNNGSSDVGKQGE